MMPGAVRIGRKVHDDCVMPGLFSGSPPKNTTDRSRVRRLLHESVRGVIAISRRGLQSGVVRQSLWCRGAVTDSHRSQLTPSVLQPPEPASGDEYA